MKANELRIGDLVRLFLGVDDNGPNYREYKISGIMTDSIGSSHYLVGNMWIEISNNLEPIPLTEEWLLKFGFRKVSVCEYELSIKLEKFEDWWDYYKEEETSIYVILEDGIMVEVNKVGVKSKDEDLEVMSFKLPHIQNVHQLQNLFQSLTNEELI
jgi:hypothetical protein